MLGPKHKASLAKDVAISLVRPLLYFVLGKNYYNPSKKLVNKLKKTIPNYFPHVHICSCIKAKKKGKLV